MSYLLFLCPDSQLDEKSLNNESWDFHYGNGKLGCSVTYDANGNQMVTYNRFGDDDGVEPLIHCREFHGIKKDYIEILEEFRLFHNLYHDKVNNKFVKIDESGAEEDIIVVKEDQVQIKLKPLKQYLAIKEMHLAIFFSIDRHSDKTLAHKKNLTLDVLDRVKIISK